MSREEKGKSATLISQTVLILLTDSFIVGDCSVNQRDKVQAVSKQMNILDLS